jgi:hypothetical protein
MDAFRRSIRGMVHITGVGHERPALHHPTGAFPAWRDVDHAAWVFWIWFKESLLIEADCLTHRQGIHSGAGQ